MSSGRERMAAPIPAAIEIANRGANRGRLNRDGVRPDRVRAPDARFPPPAIANEQECKHDPNRSASMTDVKKWPRFHGPRIDLIKRLFLAGESMNLDDFVRFFTDDAHYQFGNAPVVYGPAGIIRPSLDFLKKVEGMHHHLKNIWTVEEDTLVVEMEVTYVRHDGKVFTLPCCDIIRFDGDKIREMRIFMDISPVHETPMLGGDGDE